MTNAPTETWRALDYSDDAPEPVASVMQDVIRLWLDSYMRDLWALYVRLVDQWGPQHHQDNVGEPEWAYAGSLIQGAPFLFCAFLINAVGRASFELIGEVRRQFANDPGIMKRESKPDYGACVAIVTRAAQRELIGPGILAIALPLLVVFGLAIGGEVVNVGGHDYYLAGAQALGAFLAGTILSGQLMAVLLANSGGIWDNAKKIIEDGMHGGTGTEAHKAGVLFATPLAIRSRIRPDRLSTR